MSFNLVEHFYGHHFAPPLADTGYPRLFARHRRPYRTADGYLCAMPYTDAHWQRFFIEGGVPEAAADARFANRAHQEHRRALHARRAGDRDAHHRSVARSLRAARSAGLAHEPAGRPGGRRTPQGVRLFKTIDDPKMGRLQFPGAPVRIDRRQLPVAMAPRLGEHTHQVLTEAGIAALGTVAPALQGAPI